MDDVVAVVGQSVGETDVGGGVQQHIVALGAEDIHGGYHAAQDGVGVADVLMSHALHAVAVFVPIHNAVQIFLPRHEVTVGGVLGALNDGLGDGGRGGEIHVGHPHGNGVKALLRRTGGPGFSQQIHGNGIHTGPL